MRIAFRCLFVVERNCELCNCSIYASPLLNFAVAKYINKEVIKIIAMHNTKINFWLFHTLSFRPFLNRI